VARVQSWTPEDWSNNLKKRFDAARRYRQQFEGQWMRNKYIVDNATARDTDQVNITFTDSVELEGGQVDSGDSEIGINFAFKYLRFLHSQLSANPPSVIARPASTDAIDKKRADMADRLVRYGRIDLDMEDLVDQMSLKTLKYGTGYLKQVWDADRGDVHDFNEETNDIILNGDIYAYSPATEDIWLDPDARRAKEVRFMFERLQMPIEEAMFRFPDQEEQIKKAVENQSTSDSSSLMEDKPHEDWDDSVVIYEYYEKALPVNGMAGRHAFFLETGEVIGEPESNPHYQKNLPYHIFTYIDQDEHVYGKSIVEYVARLQDMLNRLDSSILDNIQAHGVIRMAIHETADIEDEAISDSTWDYIKYSGDREPKFINAPTLMQDIWRFRDQLVLAIQELYGINDSMMGIQRREQSAVSQQTAIEAGTMIHRRLFKKYSMAVQSFYRDFLGLVRENWTEPRIIRVTGKEHALDAVKIKGADIAGNTDVIVEYGASLPLDPNMKREALMLLKPLLQEAGMSPKQILHHMKLNDLEGVYDRIQMSRDRQREVFEEMVAKYREGIEEYIPPHEMEEHQGRLDYAYDYLESAEFRDLEEDLKTLIRQHVKEREELSATQQAPAGGSAELPGSPGVSGAMPPEMGGATPMMPLG